MKDGCSEVLPLDQRTLPLFEPGGQGLPSKE